MKVKYANWLAGTALAITLSIAGAAKANTILNVGLTDPYALGNILNGIQAGGQVNRDIDMINYLITVPLNTTQDRPSDGDHYMRSANNFGTLPTAVATGAQFAATTTEAAFTGNKLLLTLTSSFTYLLVAYDGPNGGAQVYDIASIVAGTTLEITRYARPSVAGSPGTGPLVDGTSAQQYQMTGWTLLNPGTTQVPDGGVTVMMLGGALGAIWLLRKKLAAA